MEQPAPFDATERKAQEASRKFRVRNFRRAVPLGRHEDRGCCMRRHPALAGADRCASETIALRVAASDALPLLRCSRERQKPVDAGFVWIPMSAR